MLLPLLTLAGLASSTIAALDPKAASTSSYVKGKYIVQVAPSSSLSARANIGETLEHLLQSLLAGTNVNSRIQHEWTTDLFSGAVVQLDSVADLSALQDSPLVEKIWPVRRYLSPASSVTVTAANETTFVADSFAPHVMTGVSKLHDLGYYGAGMVVGILDTGVDYYHPALGGGFGSGFKIAKGYDFAGNTYNGFSNLDITPDADPYSNATCGGHGTHVSGIVAASSTSPLFTGMVPQATLGMYKIFGCTDVATGLSHTDDELIISGLIRAYDDGSDVINLSLGGAGGWSESPAAVVASQIVAAGRVVTISQGNAGTAGTFFASSPSSGKNVWSCGSVDNLGLTGFQAEVTGGGNITDFVYYASSVSGFSSLPIYALSLDSSAANTGDACETLPASTPDLSGYLVVAKRGTCTFFSKYAVIAAAGGKNVLIYNDASALTYIPSGSSYGLDSVAIVSAEDGAALLAISQSSALVSADKATVVSVDYESAGKISDFSSYGPNWELDGPSPAFSGPGGNILSTWPLEDGGYSIASGTSMAAPAIAGGAALYWSIKGKTAATAIELRDIFVSTSTPVADYTDTTLLESVVHQGGGLMNVYNAVMETVVVSPGFLLLNDTRNFNPIHEITVKNTGSKTVTLKISHDSAGTALTFVEGSTTLHNTWPVPLVKTGATVLFSKYRLELRPGESESFLATFIAPLGLDATQAPIYSGYINIGANHSIPYYGLAAPLKSLQILDDTDTVLGIDLPTLLTEDGNVIDKQTTANLSLSNNGIVYAAFRLVAGTRFMSLDVVKSTISLDPTFTKRSHLSDSPSRMDFKRGAIPLMMHGDTSLEPRGVVAALPFRKRASSFASVPTLGMVTSEEYSYRNADDTADYYAVAFNGTVTTPTNSTAQTLSPGSYKLLLRALKLTGNPLKESDYETWLSSVIEITT